MATKYCDFRSEPAVGLPYFVPKPRVAAGTAILPPGHEVTAESVHPAFRPISLRNVTVQNRVWVAPMCMYSSKDGFFSDFHVVHYGQWAMRGAGMITVEQTAVTETGRNTPQDAGLWSDEHIAPLKRIVDIVHSQCQKVAIQLQHAGRKAGVSAPWLGLKLVPEEHGGWPDQVYGPTPGGGAWNDNYASPVTLTEKNIFDIIQAFGDAARRAVVAGVDAIAVHGAHGYLLHSFASAASNERTGDQWGGSFENRTRLGLEVVRAIRRNIPDGMPIFYKISAVDWLPESLHGWTLEDTLKFVPLLVDAGVDLVDISSGGVDRRQKVALGPQYQVPFAAAVKRLDILGLTVATVGWVRDAATVSDILTSGNADVVHVAREFLRNPNFVQTVALATATETAWVDQYHRAPTSPYTPATSLVVFQPLSHNAQRGPNNVHNLKHLQAPDSTWIGSRMA
ncbi:nadh-dependent flavin oxidoreductase [Ophiostoma piceae UAMH 11346]|uniref:Nadh-dependent flavin oxidoreductase n=1 Tax=Ophiostoma piceae (strain UAMH 11346) TaxID=1262450 RepID=S3CCQ5_OPHP1|nr:nadh-dependent flavin oxidoreductase [Ophiostoma piceae UAMH 11346]